MTSAIDGLPVKRPAVALRLSIGAGTFTRIAPQGMLPK
jgi:hypothetical protein